MPRRLFLTLLAFTLPFLAGCGDENDTPLTQVSLAVQVDHSNPIGSGVTAITLNEGYLHFSSIEVVTGTTARSGSSISHGSNDGVAIETGPVSIDLLQAQNVLVSTNEVPPGRYDEVHLNVAPAATGPAAGLTMMLTGVVANDAVMKPFRVEWTLDAEDFKTFTPAGLVVQLNLPVELVISLRTAALFQGVDLLTGTETNGEIVISSTSNTALHDAILDNLFFDLAFEVQ